jgi:hypothetical protein
VSLRAQLAGWGVARRYGELCLFCAFHVTRRRIAVAVRCRHIVWMAGVRLEWFGTSLSLSNT